VKKFQALTEVVRPEGQTAGDAVLGEGAASPRPHQLEGLGDCCKLPQSGDCCKLPQPDLGRTPAKTEFGALWH